MQQQLSKYTSNRPQVNGSAVHLGRRGEKTKASRSVVPLPLTFEPSRSSGARYQSVTTTGVYPLSGDPYSRASPKSPTCKKYKKVKRANLHVPATRLPSSSTLLPSLPTFNSIPLTPPFYSFPLAPPLSPSPSPPSPSHLQDALVTQEQIGSLQVSMQYPVVVEMVNSPQELDHQSFHLAL